MTKRKRFEYEFISVIGLGFGYDSDYSAFIIILPFIVIQINTD